MGERITLSSKAASELVGVWLADLPFKWWPLTLTSEVKDKFNFPWTIRAKAFVATYSPIAGDALWEDDLLKAHALLMRYGVCTRAQRKPKVPRNRPGMKNGSVQFRVIPVRQSGRAFAPGSDWKYVK